MIDGIVIRRPEPSEYGAVTSVWKLSWESTGLTHPDDMGYEDLCEKLRIEVTKNWDLYVADLHGRIVGMLLLKLAENQLDQLFVHPEFKDSGIGRHLLNFAKAKMPKGIWLRTAELNSRAIDFYKTGGFSFERIEARPEYNRNDVYYHWRPALEY